MKPAKPVKALTPEKQTENQILNYLKLRGIFCWKNQSVGIYDAKRGVYRKSSNQHHIKGTSDILGILPSGHFLAIEVKNEKGYASPEQKEFIRMINHHGGIAFVARSLQDVVDRFTKKDPNAIINERVNETQS